MAKKPKKRRVRAIAITPKGIRILRAIERGTFKFAKPAGRRRGAR